MAQLLDAVVERDVKITERDVEIAKLKTRVRELESKTGIADRDAEIAKLKTRVAELETQPGQNSTNSHKPPSSDPPGTRPPKRGTGKQRGAQPGHKPSTRVLLPPEKVTRRTQLKPKRCACCGGRDLTILGVDPRRHQVIDVPEILVGWLGAGITDTIGGGQVAYVGGSFGSYRAALPLWAFGWVPFLHPLAAIDGNGTWIAVAAGVGAIGAALEIGGLIMAIAGAIGHPAPAPRGLGMRLGAAGADGGLTLDVAF